MDVTEKACQWWRTTWTESEKVNGDFGEFMYNPVECRHVGVDVDVLQLRCQSLDAGRKDALPR